MSNNEFAGLPVIAAARRAYSPTRDAQERVKLATLATGAKLDAFERASSDSAGTDVSAELPSDALSVGGLKIRPWISKAIVASCFTAAGFGAGYWARSEEIATERALSEAASVSEVPIDAPQAPPPQQPTGQKANAVVELAPSAPQNPAPDEAKEPTAALSPSGTVHRAGRATSLEEEAALLGQVERALRAEDTAGAEAALKHLDKRVPRGKLGEEREALAIIALCQAERPEGAGRAAEFALNHPSSVYLRRVEQACAKK